MLRVFIVGSTSNLFSMTFPILFSSKLKTVRVPLQEIPHCPAGTLKHKTEAVILFSVVFLFSTGRRKPFLLGSEFWEGSLPRCTWINDFGVVIVNLFWQKLCRGVYFLGTTTTEQLMPNFPNRAKIKHNKTCSLNNVCPSKLRNNSLIALSWIVLHCLSTCLTVC